MFNKQIKFYILFLSCFVLFGCKSSIDNRIPVKEIKDKKIIVTINSKNVYEDEFFTYNETVLKEMNIEDFDNSDIKEKLLNDFIEHKMLVFEAQRNNLEIDNSKISGVLEAISSVVGSQDLKVYAGTYNTDSNKLSQLLKERLLVEMLFNKELSTRIIITEKELKDYYSKIEKVKNKNVKAHIQHIFTRDKDIAKTAMSELRKGLSFNEVAERYSEAPEKDNGGDLGFISEHEYPEIFSVAFKLPINKVSDIVQSDYGYHIFLVKKVSQGKIEPFEVIKSKLYYELYAKKQEEETRKYIDELYKKNKIDIINPINFDNFKQ